MLSTHTLSILDVSTKCEQLNAHYYSILQYFEKSINIYSTRPCTYYNRNAAFVAQTAEEYNSHNKIFKPESNYIIRLI